jgi:hypothetical protein
MDIKNIGYDTNGNIRHVVHFTSFSLPTDKGTVSQNYEAALKRARNYGGKKFNRKKFGGGIVFQNSEREVRGFATEVQGF